MIKPTVGRVVLYRPLEEDRDDIRHAALVAMVHDVEHVNLTCFDSNGQTYHRQNVTLIQDGLALPDKGQCEWMPYQHGQAAKYDTAMDAVLERLRAIEEFLAAEGIELNSVDTGGAELSEEIPSADVAVSDEVMVLAANAHEHVRGYCVEIGEEPAPDWDSLDDQAADGVISTVLHIIDNPDIEPSELHGMWIAARSAAGWVHGNKLDREAMVHPNLVPFDDLPEVQQAKTVIFINTVRQHQGLEPLQMIDTSTAEAQAETEGVEHEAPEAGEGVSEETAQAAESA